MKITGRVFLIAMLLLGLGYGNAYAATNPLYGSTPPSSPTPSSSTQSLTKGSLIKNKTIYYPSQGTDTMPIITRSDGTKPLGTLPQCRNDPTQITSPYTAITTSNDYSPTREDIEGNFIGPSGPPDLCTVSSVVYYRQPNGTVTTSPATNTIHSTITAVCPDGYAQVGAFNMQPEIIYNTISGSEYPATIARRTELSKMGYDCVPDGISRYVRSGCHYFKSESSGSENTSFTFDSPINTLKEVTTSTTIPVSGYQQEDRERNPTSRHSTKFPMAGVIKFTSLIAPGWNSTSPYSSQCMLASDSAWKCESSPSLLAGCVPNCTVVYGGTSSTISCSYSWPYALRTLYIYQYEKCSIKPGFIVTGNTVPSTLICARIKSKYDSVYLP